VAYCFKQRRACRSRHLIDSKLTETVATRRSDRLRLAYIGLMSGAKTMKKAQVDRLFELAKRLVAKDAKIRLQAP